MCVYVQIQHSMSNSFQLFFFSFNNDLTIAVDQNDFKEIFIISVTSSKTPCYSYKLQSLLHLTFPFYLLLNFVIHLHRHFLFFYFIHSFILPSPAVQWVCENLGFNVLTWNFLFLRWWIRAN